MAVPPATADSTTNESTFRRKRDGTKREEMKQKSIELVNKEFGLDLKWISKSSKFNQDDISDSILIAYSYFINT